MAARPAAEVVLGSLREAYPAIQRYTVDAKAGIPARPASSALVASCLTASAGSSFTAAIVLFLTVSSSDERAILSTSICLIVSSCSLMVTTPRIALRPPSSAIKSKPFAVMLAKRIGPHFSCVRLTISTSPCASR